MEECTDENIYTNHVVRIAKAAGQKIMEVYSSEDYLDSVEFKEDESPLTLADKEAHRLIEQELLAIAPEVPIVSEEGELPAYEQRRDWDRLWIVDPLDGTKEFLKRSGYFTVNIALIQKGFPIMGVIFAPALDSLYFADASGAFCIDASGGRKRLSVPPLPDYSHIRALQSRIHLSPFDVEATRLLDVQESIAIGSSLKFCTLAEGKGDIYLRNAPLREWDIAAGQAILERSGGRVNDINGNRLRYNTSDFVGGPFFAYGYSEQDDLGWDKLKSLL